MVYVEDPLGHGGRVLKLYAEWPFVLGDTLSFAQGQMEYRGHDIELYMVIIMGWEVLQFQVGMGDRFPLIVYKAEGLTFTWFPEIGLSSHHWVDVGAYYWNWVALDEMGTIHLFLIRCEQNLFLPALKVKCGKMFYDFFNPPSLGPTAAKHLL